MTNLTNNELELAPDAVVRQAAHDFASALAETPQFGDFERASLQLSQDEAAQRAEEAFQAKQQALEVMRRLNAVSAEEKAELDRLYQAYITEPSVAACLEAQNELQSICQTAAEVLSTGIGLSYAAACGACCS
jgi:cell fate (sporulation/competence/biofilm development) regulator YlbF (YheA/YmcA/DUF963 family)